MAPLRPLPGNTELPTKSILKKRDGKTPIPKASDSLFASSKEDKRRIKHAQFIAKVKKTQSSKPRRRRPSKKLATTLSSLADALPEDVEDTERQTRATDASAMSQINIIRRKSLKSKPGALKRRQKLDNHERERFGKNLAQLATSQPVAQSMSPAEKLRALRGFISQTLEKKPEVASVGA